MSFKKNGCTYCTNQLFIVSHHLFEEKGEKRCPRSETLKFPTYILVLGIDIEVHMSVVYGAGSSSLRLFSSGSGLFFFFG